MDIDKDSMGRLLLKYREKESKPTKAIKKNKHNFWQEIKDMKIRNLITIVFVLLVIEGGYMLINKNTETKEIPNTTDTPVSTFVIPTENNNMTNITRSPNLTKPTTIKCELCHLNPENINQHVNGGKFCANCHGSQVHNIHIGENTVNLDCKTCHGMPPKIPRVEKGAGPGHYIVCENCHAPPPNSLNASLGNLIIIHLSRGKYCTNCHGLDIGKIHEAVLNKTRK